MVQKKYHMRMVHTIRVQYVPYAYGIRMYHTHMVCTIRVWYEICVHIHADILLLTIYYTACSALQLHYVDRRLY